MRRLRLFSWLVLLMFAGMLLLFVATIFLITTLGRATVSKTPSYPESILSVSEPDIHSLEIGALPLSPLWQANVEMPIDRPTRVSDNVVIAIGANKIVGLNSETGMIMWTCEVSRDVHDFRMRDIKLAYPYLAFQIFPGWGPLHIIDITTGKQVWNSENSTAVFDLSYNTAFVQLADTATYEAVDLINGSIVWEFEADTTSRLTQIQYESERLFIWNGDEFYILDPSNGRIVTEHLGEPFSSLRADWLQGDRLYVVKHSPDRIVAANVSEGQVDWEFSVGNTLLEPFFAESSLYLANSPGNLVSIDLNSGEVLWEYSPGVLPKDSEIQNKLVSNVVEIDGVVYGLFSDATLRGVNADNGLELGSIKFPSISQSAEGKVIPGLAAKDNKLFVSLGYHTVYAFESH